jgi:molybdopterin adenylyltransferase
MRVAILTISTQGAAGKRADTSGDAIASWIAAHSFTLAERALVADDVNAIVRELSRWCDDDSADLVLTTGGTGLSPTDLTPEATRAVIEREAPGIAEFLRASAVARVPKAVLSRGVCGTRNRTMIVNLPGSPGGVKDALGALEPIVEHAVAVLRGEVGDHGKP